MKTKITFQEFIDFLYYFVLKFGKEAVDHELSKENSPFKDANRDVFIHERMILIFWMIDMIIASKEKKIIGALHEKYFQDKGLSNSLKNEETKEELFFIMKRYKEYYNTWDSKVDGEQLVLGGTIAKNILQKDKLVIDAMVVYLTLMDFFLVMRKLKELIIDKYELDDTFISSGVTSQKTVKKVPEELHKCEKCGEYKGKVKKKDLNWDNSFNKEEAEKSEEYLTVSCLCDGILCPKCKKSKIHKPISNSYDEESNTIEHWPWFTGMRPCNECGEKNK